MAVLRRAGAAGLRLRATAGSEVNNLYNSDERLFDKFFSQMAKQTLVQDQQMGGGVAMPDGYAFSHDPQRCIKCYTCEIACKQWRGIAPGTFKLRRVYEITTGTFPQVTRTFHSVACQHCPDAPCVLACPPGAI